MSKAETNEGLRPFRGAAHLSAGALIVVPYLALVGIKRYLYLVLRFFLRMFAGFELSITAFADSDGWQWRLYDAELAGIHDGSLAHQGGR